MVAKSVYSTLVLYVIIMMAVAMTASCIDSVKPSSDIRTNTAEDRAAVYLGDPPVLISEIYTANPDYKDEFGSDPGWVEFYNPSDAPADLSGYCLTNNADANPGRWCFGNVVVPPREFILVFMSGRNIPDYVPPSDSIDLIGKTVIISAWADIDNTPPGKSTVENLSVFGQSIGGVLRPADNSPVLTWATATIEVRFRGWSNDNTVVDMSGTNQILLRGFISEGSRLQVRIAPDGTDIWEAWSAVLTGTGAADDLYAIDLSQIPADDLAKIYGIRFENIYNDFKAIEFNFNSITARRRSGNIHASWSLANNGGRLFLTDGDGHIRDSVAYPAATLGLSYARKIEDGVNGAWAHSKPPTPLGMNSAETYEGGKLDTVKTTVIPNSGNYSGTRSFVIPDGDNGAIIACDLTGALPTKDSQLKSGSTVNITSTTVMRCAQFKDGAHPSDPIMRTYIIGRLPDLPIVSIAVDPFDMFDATHGLYAMGPNGRGASVCREPYMPCYGANFWAETELPVQIEFFERNMRPGWTHNAGLRIFGNWSRANDKKSVVISFRDIYGQGRLNYRLFPDNPELTRFKHFVLRNNGNNFDMDYIRDMLMTSLTDALPTDGSDAKGLGIDYQRGRAVIVYYNGDYYGIHNLRERANGDYFDTKYGIAQEYVDLVKASGEVSQGSDADYQNIVSWLESFNGLSDDNLRQLEQRIDTDNFTYNFMCRMYYHDRDWPGNNMKRWRQNSPVSRWKWLMYDTDHGWGSHGMGTMPNVSTMAFVTASNSFAYNNSPRHTFMLRKLLQNDSYKYSFINRFSLMMATYFASDRVNARIDALMAPIQSEIPYDQQRWGHDVARMNSQMTTIRNFNNDRRPTMQNEIRSYFNLGSDVDFTVSVTGNANGRIRVHGLEVMNNSATFKAYPGAPVVLTAVSGNGAVFERWSDGVTEAERTVTVTAGQPVTLRAEFVSGPVSVLERDRVIPAY